MSAEIKTKRLFVGNLSFSTRWYELKDHFKQAGNVTYANIIRDRKSKRSRGCGVVEMETLEQAQQAVNTLHESELAARKIFVREDQRPESDRPEQQDGQQQERKPREPREPRAPKQPTQEGDKPQEKREKREKKPQGEKKVASEKKEVKAEEKKDAPVTSAAPVVAEVEGEKKKKKRRRSKKKKATTATGDTTATTTATTAPSTTAPKAEGEDEEGGFREIKRRERRGRATTSRGGSRSESRGEPRGERKEPRVPREKPTTESGDASPAPRQKKERQLDPTKSSGKAIFVSNLPLTFKAEELNQLFAEAGAIASSELKTDKSGKVRGLATVLFETPEAAKKAIDIVNEKEVGGRKVNVRLDFYQ